MSTRMTSLVVATCCVLAWGAAWGEDPVRVTAKVASSCSNHDHCEADFTLAGEGYHATFTWPHSGEKGYVPRLYFTADKDEGYTDYQRFPAILGVEQRLYAVAFDGDTKKLTFSPCSGRTRKLRVTLAVERLSLTQVGEEEVSVLLYRPGDTVRVPAGTYRLAEYQLTRNDEAGEPWYLCARATPESPELKVRRRLFRPSKLAIGGPYRPGLVFPEDAKELINRQAGAALKLQYALEGSWKEHAAQVFPIDGKKRPAAPTFRIRRVGGSVVHEGRFRYG